MEAQSKHVFSKILTVTDIKKRLAVPSAIQRSLPPFNGGGANAMGYGNIGTGDHEHAAAEAYPQIITPSHQGLLRQPTTPYGAELDLTLALAPPNLEGNTMVGSMARL
ncbi:hypothetical protein GOBAR_DD30356 [Gossypium barbadense]|nr:hypothetical protein GOBAR_DD30356 [Gossypium barbadense]